LLPLLLQDLLLLPLLLHDLLLLPWLLPDLLGEGLGTTLEGAIGTVLDTALEAFSSTGL
jgi:hypothetical protein